MYAIRSYYASGIQYRHLRDQLRRPVVLDTPTLRAWVEAPEPYSLLPISERLVQAIWYVV